MIALVPSGYVEDVHKGTAGDAFQDYPQWVRRNLTDDDTAALAAFTDAEGWTPHIYTSPLTETPFLFLSREAS